MTPNPGNSSGGRQWYDGTGTAHARLRPVGCDEASVTVPVATAQLVLDESGPQPGTYQLSVAALATTTFQCGDPRRPTPGGPPVSVSVFGSIEPNGPCPHPMIGGDLGRLAGSWSCNEADPPLRSQANWTLRAVE